MKIAIVGAGISGLACAYSLRTEHDVSIFEAEPRLGGHTHTVRVEHEGQPWWVDTGFIVFNERNYPNFCTLLRELGVASKPTTMSFSVRRDDADFEYGGESLNGLFAQRKHLVSRAFHRMINDILRFGHESRVDADGELGDLTLGEYLSERRYGGWFSERYLVPMGSAIWSSSLAATREMPMRFFVRFFENHGMLLPKERPKWRVIEGGSHEYVKKLEEAIGGNAWTGMPVESVRRLSTGVEVAVRGRGAMVFDRVVFACHSDQALRLLADPTRDERRVLGAIGYTPNDVVLHTDASILPRRKRAWASWNYRVGADDPGRAIVTYNMSMLQGLATRSPICVTLNSTASIDPSRILGRYVYHHPAYTRSSIAAQREHGVISGGATMSGGRTHFCGAYWGNGFHEDGVNSALRVCGEIRRASVEFARGVETSSRVTRTAGA